MSFEEKARNIINHLNKENRDKQLRVVGGQWTFFSGYPFHHIFIMAKIVTPVSISNPRTPSFLMTVFTIGFRFITALFSKVFTGLLNQVLSTRERLVEGGSSHNFEVNRTGNEDNASYEFDRNISGEPSNVPLSGSHFNTKINNNGNFKNSNFRMRDNRNYQK